MPRVFHRIALLLLLGLMGGSGFGQVYFDRLYESEAFETTNEGIWGDAVKTAWGYTFHSFARDLGVHDSQAWIVETDFNGIISNESFHGYQGEIFMPVTLLATETGYLGLSRYYSDTLPSSQHSQFAILSYNLDLTVDWVKHYGEFSRNDLPFSLIISNDGGSLMVGQSTDSTGSDGDFYVVKTDSTGNHEWDVLWGGSNFESAHSSIQTFDDGFLILGWTRSFGAGQRDFYLLKLDSTGTQEWHQTYGGSDMETGTSIIALNDETFLLAGAQIVGGIDKGKMIKVDDSGSVIWQQEYIYASAGACELNQIIELEDSSIIGAGVADSPGEGNSGWLIKTDSHGEMVWQRKYNKNQFTDLFYSVLATDDGGFLLSGQAINDTTGSQDAWLLKVDSIGCPYPNCLVGIDELGSQDVLVDVWPNPANDVLNLEVGGWPSSSTQRQAQGDGLSVTVVDMQGKQMPHQVRHDKKRMSIDVSDWPNGLYVLTLTTERQQASVRVVVQH